jgi:hypothetical protein
MIEKEIPQNWEEILELEINTRILSKSFPYPARIPEFPIHRRHALIGSEDFLKYQKKMLPSTEQLGTIDAELAKQISELYLKMCRDIVCMVTNFIELLPKPDEESHEILKKLHSSYADFVRDSTVLRHLHEQARDKLLKQAIIKAFECESGTIAKGCEQEGSHFCFLNYISRFG